MDGPRAAIHEPPAPALTISVTDISCSRVRHEVEPGVLGEACDQAIRLESDAFEREARSACHAWNSIRMITFALHGYEGADPAHEIGPLKAEFEKRGVPCMIVRSPRTKTKTPNRDRAKIMVETLRSVEGDVALVGSRARGCWLRPRAR
jgi:hypothetical protein